MSNQQIRIVAVCFGLKSECGVFLTCLPPQVPLLVDEQARLRLLYGVPGAPTAVIMNSRQKVQAYSHPSDIDDLTLSLTRAEKREKQKQLQPMV
jgi:hypothetical protein